MNKKYELDDVIKNFKKLTKELGHEPTAFEVDDCEYLPPSRTIQRRWGGLQGLRKTMGYEVTNHTKGATRSATAAVAQKRAKKYEADLFHQLHKKYHDVSGTTTYVTREWAYQQWLPKEQYYSNTRCDVCIDDRRTGHHILIDFFYPENLRTMGGCIRGKRKKLQDYPVALYDDATHEILFVCVNPDISQKQIDEDGTNKKGVKILSLENFTTKFLK